MDGWISLHRQILESNIRPKGKFSHFEAWVYLLLMTNHQDTRWNGIIVKRGQHATSQLGLSKEWGWSLGNTNRFLNSLKTENRIEIKATTKYTILEIINYDKYQSCSNNIETKNENRMKTKRKQNETYNNDNNENNDNKSLSKDNGAVAQYGNIEINNLLKAFTDKGIGITKQKLNRFAGQRLIKKYGYEKTLSALEYALSVLGENYAPQILNLMDLEEKMNNLIMFKTKGQNDRSKNAIG